MEVHECVNYVMTVSHLFWEFPKIQPILKWVKRVYDDVTIGLPHPHFVENFFLYGFPRNRIEKSVFSKVWYVFCITKFILWKSRCLQVFESKYQSAPTILSIIITEIKTRVAADYKRFTKTKFDKVWVGNNSFVIMRDKKLKFRL